MEIRIEDRIRREVTPERSEKHGDDTAPKRPDVGQPKPSNPLLDRMKKIDPDQAKKYRQRSGE